MELPDWPTAEGGGFQFHGLLSTYLVWDAIEGGIVHT